MFRSKRARIGAGAVAVAMIAAVTAGCGSSSSSSSAASSSTPAAAASTSSTTTSSASTSGGSGARMAIFYYNPSPYGVASLKGAQAEASKLGVKLDAFDANNDPQMQSTQIQDAITTGKYKAFWVWGLNDVALTPIINKALSSGIKVAAADYTWGPLSSQNVLTASSNPKLVTTVGQSIGAESTNLIAAMNAACKKQVGTGHCNIAFLPGLANYPTDTVRENAMTAYYKGKPNYTFTILPPGMYDQAASQKVAQTYFTANKNVNVFATFGDQMAAGAVTAMKLVGGYTPGKNIAVIGYGGALEAVQQVKSGTWYATLGLYPASESEIGIAALNDALNGKPTAPLVNIINPATRPAIIDQAYLTAHPDFHPDWTLEGGIN
ncbi:MAG TPA: sugar ABC transporter substrate-binding protein [Solirubrobacteraceae bacterium]|nr:sugar ABC transporter substrate-binding protein [Solirubrobacteraceae bacterium]